MSHGRFLRVVQVQSFAAFGALLAFAACDTSSDITSTPPEPSRSDAAVLADATVDSTAADSTAIDGDAKSDSEAAAPGPCDLGKPFGTPVLVPAINSGVFDRDAWLSPDELTIYLTSNRDPSGYNDIYVATRATKGDDFPTPTTFLSNVTTGYPEQRPTVTADGLRIYYSNSGVGALASADIFTASRTVTTDPFTSITNVTELNIAGSAINNGVAISPDGSSIWFASDRDGDFEIFHATKGGATFTGLGKVTELNSGGFDNDPVPSADGLTIFLSSDRAGTGAMGGRDIWTATRATPNGTFSTPTNVPELNSASDDRPVWLSADGCSMLLVSDRAGGLGYEDIYRATRPQ